MTEPFAEKRPGHRWSKWAYSWPKRRWYRHCGITSCTGKESAARGHKPKGQK